MAVTIIGGISAVVGAAGAAGALASFSAFVTFLGTSAAFTAFAIGAGLSLVSRALAPKPSFGEQLRGITQTTRDPAGSRKLVYGQMRVGGQVVFIANSGNQNDYLHLVIAFASHEIESYEEFWFNDKQVYVNNAVDSSWSDVVTITKFDGTQTTADSTLTAVSSKWTSNHILNGIAYAHFKLKWDQDKFPQGVPNITAVIKGKKVYDPRDSNQSATDSSTWTFSQNPALCLRDYLVDGKYGLGEDRLLIDSTALTNAANLCDETQESAVNIYSTGTKRYELNGVIDTGNNIKDNIEQMLSAMGGKFTFSGGKYFIDGAEYRTPTITLDESVTISEIQVQTKQSRRGIYNGVKGIFVSEEKNYKVLDYPAQISSTYATEDGDPIYLDMPLPFVTNNLQAQLLAKLALLKSRQQTTLTMTVNLTGLKLKVGDTVMVTNTRLGYSSKVFEIIDYTLANTPGGEFGVQLTLIETASAIYDWTSSDEQDFLKGGELDLYDGRTVDNVTSLSMTEIGLRGPDGGVKSAVELSWTAPDDAFIEYYTVRYNKNGTTDYFEVQTRETNVLLEGLDVTSNYDFQVKGQNLIGVRSSGTSLTNQALNGDTTDPSKPTGGTATGGIQTITAEWSNPTDIDFKHVEVFVNTTDSIPATPTAVVDGEEYIVTGLSGAATRYFWLKSVDFSGNKSAATASFSGTSVVASSSDIGTGAVGTTEIADNSVTITKVADVLQSTNYSQGSAGWKLTTDGTFEAGDGDFRGTIKATTLDVEDANVHGTLTATAISAGIVTADALAADVFVAIDDRYGSSGGFYEEDNDEFFDGSATKYVTLSTVTHDNSKNIYFQLNIVHSWGGTTNYIGDQLKLRVTFEYSTDNSTWTTVPNSGENSQTYYERTTDKTIYSVTSAYDIAADIRYTMSGSSLSDNTAYYFRAKIEYVTSTNVFQLAAAGAANGVPIRFNVQQNAGLTATGGDSDTVDGLQASQFVRSDADDTMTGDFTLVGDLKMGDTRRIELGDDTDLKISHSGGGGTVENDTGNLTIKNRAVDGDIYFQSDDGTGYGTDTYMMLDGGEKKVKFLEEVVISDDLTVTGSLTITGNIDQYNVTDLDVTDKTITVNSGNTQALSDGAGLIVDRGTAADASITWDETSDSFSLSNALSVTGVHAGTYDVGNFYSSAGQAHLNIGRSSAQRFNFYITDAKGFVRYYQDETDGTDHSVEFQIVSSSSGTNQFYFNKQVNVTGHGNSSQWNSAYTYSQVGHLPLAGGTVTGSTTFNSSVYLNDYVYVDVAGQNFVLRSDSNQRNTLEWQQGTTRRWVLDLQADGDLNFVPSDSADKLRISNQEIATQSWVTSQGYLTSGSVIKDGGTTVISNINTIGTESIKHRWNTSTTGRPAASQANEYGTVLTLTYDSTYATQLAYDIDQGQLYMRTLNLSTDSGTWRKLLNEDSAITTAGAITAGNGSTSLGYYVGTTQVIQGSTRNLVNIGTGAFSGKLTISNANFANHLELVRGSDTLYLTPSGGQVLISGGLSPSANNTIDLGRSDKQWQDLWLGTSLKMGGTTVINSSRGGAFGSDTTITGGRLTITDNTDALRVRSTTNGVGVNINFSDHAGGSFAQQGNINYVHADGSSYGSGNAFILSSTESTLTVLADGKLMFKEGLYVKPSSGTGAGTQIIDSSRNIVNVPAVKNRANGNADTMWLVGGDVGIVLDGPNNLIRPTEETSGGINNKISLGSTTYNFKNLHLSGYLYFNDTNSALTEGSGNSLKVQTNSGYIEIGPQNTSWAHIQTDRGKFYFNKQITVDSGIVESYNEDLILRRANNSADQITLGTSGVTFASGYNLSLTGNIGGASGHVSGKFAVKSTSVHASYDLYNNGTTYLNGATIIDDALNLTGSNAKLQVGSTTVINSSRGADFTQLTRTNTRISNSQERPVGNYSQGEHVFAIDPTWSQAELQAFFNSSNVTWSAQSDAPAGYAIYINGGVNVGGAYNSGFPYIPVEDDDVFEMECWIKNVGGGQGHYMGSNEYNQSFSSLGGNPGSYGYWVMLNTDPGTSWTKVSGTIRGFNANTTGRFENGTKYWTPMALFNYTAGSGTRACYISGWKVRRVTHRNNMSFGGKAGNGNNNRGRYLSIEGNTDSSGEGSGRIFFTEHNSSTGSMDNYGMSIGYRGGSTTIQGSSGNNWTGLSQIGNGEWGMWGHNNSASGALIMYGDRAATFINFSSNSLQNMSNVRAADGTVSAPAYSFTSDTNTGFFRYGGDYIGVTTGGTRRARFGSTIFLESGDVRINANLYHNGDTDTRMQYTTDRIRFYAGGVEMLDMVEGGTDYVDIIDQVRVTAGGGLECNGNVTAFSTTTISDINQKENIERIESPIEKIKNISGYTFDWKVSGEHSGGVIAQEIEKIMPGVVKETSIRDGDKIKAVDYQAIIGLLVETVKDLNKRIEELENGNNED